MFHGGMKCSMEVLKYSTDVSNVPPRGFNDSTEVSNIPRRGLKTPWR